MPSIRNFRDIIYFFAGKPSGEAGGSTGNDLLQMTPYEDLNTTLTCLGPEVVTCNIARVQWDVITNNHDIILPTGRDANGIFDFRKCKIIIGNNVSIANYRVFIKEGH